MNKQTIKAIEQRAEEYFSKNFSRIGDMRMGEGMKTLYIEAVLDQRKIDIEKACEWLREHVRPYYKFSLESFKQAMGEEQ